MTLQTWVLFTATACALAAIPGPNMIYVLTRSAEVGLRRSLPAMAGCVSALFVVLCAAAAGLGQVVAAFPGAFTILRYAGAAYLFFVGVSAWRRDPPPTSTPQYAGRSRGPRFCAAVS